jgi:hypothetical protein
MSQHYALLASQLRGSDVQGGQQLAGWINTKMRQVPVGVWVPNDPKMERAYSSELQNRKELSRFGHAQKGFEKQGFGSS